MLSSDADIRAELGGSSIYMWNMSVAVRQILKTKSSLIFKTRVLGSFHKL